MPLSILRNNILNKVHAPGTILWSPWIEYSRSIVYWRSIEEDSHTVSHSIPIYQSIHPSIRPGRQPTNQPTNETSVHAPWLLNIYWFTTPPTIIMRRMNDAVNLWHEARFPSDLDTHNRLSQSRDGRTDGCGSWGEAGTDCRDSKSQAYVYYVGVWFYVTPSNAIIFLFRLQSNWEHNPLMRSEWIGLDSQAMVKQNNKPRERGKSITIATVQEMPTYGNGWGCDEQTN